MSDVPIAEHALLSDRHGAALVTAQGSVDWLCFPRYDSPSVFGRLLDDTAGHWSIRPVGEHRVTRRYLDGTLVLETTFHLTAGTVVLTDALAMGAGNVGHALGADAPRLLIRTVACVDGTAEVGMSYEPRPEYGLLRPILSHVDGGVTARGGAEWLVLSTPVPLRIMGSTATARLALRAGDTVRFALHRSTLEEQPARVWPDAEIAERLAGTVASWQSWSDLHRSYDGPWARPRAPQRPGAARPDIPAERRDRRGADDVAAGERRRRTQLGLPVRLGPRRELHDGGALGGRLPGRGRGLLRVHDHRRRGDRRARVRVADHVRRRRRARPLRTRPAAPARLAGQPAGAGRQRRVDPAADRRVRGTARRGATGWPTGSPASTTTRVGSSWRWPTPRPSGGATPIAGSGRSVASRGTSSTRRSCAGSRWTGRSRWPGSWTRSIGSTGGSGCGTRSTRPSSRRAGTPPSARSPSTSAPPSWTRPT